VQADSILRYVMQTLSILRKHIEILQPAMPPTDFDRTKTELLSMLESLERQCVPPAADELHGRLSRREREVMSMMLEGQRLKQIAATLDISVKTVTTHRSRLMKKLHIDDNLGLYRYGIRNGLISV
jgi:DNA-binding NarL/FixJ family response regulator